MSFPWYAFHPKDYRDKTSGLTMLQDGAYRRLMDEYYITGEPLEANASVLFRICRAFDEAEQAAVLFILEKFFVEGDDGWHHLRIDEEIIKRAELSAKRSDAGKSGGKSKNKPKTASATTNATAIAKQMPQQLPPHLHTQSHIQKKNISRAPRFDEFWSLCPNKVGKGKAEKLYAKLCADGLDPEILIAGIRRFAGSERGKDPTYIAHPKTWLNERRWEDEGVKVIPIKTAFNSPEEIEGQRLAKERAYGTAQI